MIIELEYMCDACGRSVGDADGWIGMFFADLRERRRLVQEWQLAHPGSAHYIGELLSYPGQVPWRIFHDRCNPRSEESAYDIDVREVRTWRGLLRWTAQLIDKRWLSETNWGSVVRQAADPDGPRIVAASVRGDAA
jgi:hypothetical protein